jgi:hypothetical protein
MKVIWMSETPNNIFGLPEVIIFAELSKRSG